MSTSPVKTESKRDQAYSQLRRLLILQQVPEGQRMRETEWSQRLNVNRSALREAFVRLESEGLLVAGAKTGYIVPTVTTSEFDDIARVRFVLEGAAMDLICELGFNTPENLVPLKETCDLFEHLISESFQLGAVEADRRFHEVLVELSTSPRLAAAYRHAPLPIIAPDVIAGRAWVLTEQEALSEHRQMYELLLKNEPESAKEILADHLRGARGPFTHRYMKRQNH